MAVRVSISEVKNIYSRTALSDTDIQAAITLANVLVDERVKGESGLNDTLLKEIERLLAAHFATVNEERGGLSQESKGDSSESYRGTAGTSIRSTRYGQQAIMLDPSGTLAKLGGRVARIKAIDFPLTQEDG